MSGILTTGDVAALLRITPRQVQRLVRDGQIVQVARGVLDATSVDQYATIAEPRRVPWASPTAWGAVALLSGLDASWMGASQRSRLRGRLAAMNSAELVERTRARARVARYYGHSSVIEHLRPYVIEPSMRELGLTAQAAEVVDGYVPVGSIATYVAAHGLTADSDGRIILRATTMDEQVVRRLAVLPVLAALDLAGSLDPRERRAGLDALERALQVLRD